MSNTDSSTRTINPLPSGKKDAKSLSGLELQIAVAKKKGWTSLRTYLGDLSGTSYLSKSVVRQIPPYHRDIPFARDLLRNLSYTEKVNFGIALSNLVEGKDWPEKFFNCINASAEDLCRAYLEI